MQPRAIETRYKGYRFRSRLEARWAVFFDALGLKWEYEPEGFELPGGVRYLPDFRIELTDTKKYSWTFWFEVKPEVGGDLTKAKAFAETLQCGEEMIFLVGMPTVGRAYKDVKGFGWWLWSHRERPWHNDDGNWSNEDFYESFSFGDLAYEQRAVEAARSARFEFGESGAR